VIKWQNHVGCRLNLSRCVSSDTYCATWLHKVGLAALLRSDDQQRWANCAKPTKERGGAAWRSGEFELVQDRRRPAAIDCGDLTLHSVQPLGMAPRAKLSVYAP
jgi:hypothetical protein